MKQFKKWFDKKKKLLSHHLPDEIDCGMGWRAALEGVLKQLDIIYNSDFENSEIVKWIEKELGESK